MGAPLVSHPDVAHVGFTGGEAAGVRVYELAARGLKTVTLELGGKSPNIVFEDADLDQALNGVFVRHLRGVRAELPGRLAVAVAALRFTISSSSVWSQFAREHQARRSQRWPDTQMGPIATRPQFEKILKYIEIAKAEGARCVARRTRAAGDRRRAVHRADDLHRREISMRIAQEEVFGPVLCVIPFEDEADAIRIGNDVAYGLAGGGLDARSASRDVDDREAQGRHGLGQQLPRHQLHLAVRRHETLRAWDASPASMRSGSIWTPSASGSPPTRTSPIRSFGAEAQE